MEIQKEKMDLKNNCKFRYARGYELTELLTQTLSSELKVCFNSCAKHLASISQINSTGFSCMMGKKREKEKTYQFKFYKGYGVAMD